MVTVLKFVAFLRLNEYEKKYSHGKELLRALSDNKHKEALNANPKASSYNKTGKMLGTFL